MPPGPTRPPLPCGAAADPRSWMAVPGPSSGVPAYGTTRSPDSPSAGIDSVATRGRPFVAAAEGSATAASRTGAAPAGVGVSRIAATSAVSAALMSFDGTRRPMFGFGKRRREPADDGSGATSVVP